jgi:hypothetical protein
MMKMLQFFKTEYIATLIFLSLPLPVLGNQFYDSLPDLKLEEIKIIDNNTVEIGIGLDNRSVSCNILEALQSIPYVGAGGEPDTVFVNNEKIYHFRKGLYTWDREGKYRVLLSAKYIRDFGSIQIHVPEAGPVMQEKQKTSSKNITSAFHQSLPQNIKEEITIIDEGMVEVGIGPDDNSVSTTILHAINSIPSVKEGVEPRNVLVNEEPIHYVRKGVYAWDVEGKNVVKLTTKYIRKFGNIQIHLTGEEPSFVSRKEPEPLPYKDPTALSKFFPTANLPRKHEPRPVVKEILIEKKNIFPEPIATHPDIKEESFAESVLSTRPLPLPHKLMTGVIKGFRLAQFGMSEDLVVKTIQADFSQSENNIEKRKDPKTDQRVLTISSLTLNPKNGKALIHYYFSLKDQTLVRVDIIWGHPDYSKVDHSVLNQSAKEFKNLFSKLVTQSDNSGEGYSPYIFYGEDILGNGVKLKWDKSYKTHFQPLSKPEPTLLLSYFQPLK